jgi:hypothetical protein
MFRLMFSRKLLPAIALIATMPFGFAPTVQANPGTASAATQLQMPTNQGTAADLGSPITLPEELVNETACFLERIESPNGSFITLAACSRGNNAGVNPEILEQLNLRAQINKQGFEETNQLKIDLFRF